MRTNIILLTAFLLHSNSYALPTDNFEHVKVYAHMGGRDQAPQNSDAAYYMDLVKHYDYVDIDVNLTADHKVVARHDH